jgi:hypothetical protein
VFATATANETSNLAIALIALGGAIVGGLLTGGAQLLAERMTHKREREVAGTVVVGVERVIDYFLSMWEVLLAQAFEQGSWWNSALEPVPGWSDADLQLVASSCDDRSWSNLRAALVMTRAASTMRETAGDDPDLRFSEIVSSDSGDGVRYQAMLDAIRAGRAVIR